LADWLFHGIVKPVFERHFSEFEVSRADHVHDPGLITGRIIGDIHSADLVIADLTSLNPNAFYELGICHSFEKSTIHMARFGQVLPFDNKDYRTIFFSVDSPAHIDKAKEELQKSVASTQKKDFVPINPVTNFLRTAGLEAERLKPDLEPHRMSELLKQHSEAIDSLSQRLREIDSASSARSSFDDGSASLTSSHFFSPTLLGSGATGSIFADAEQLQAIRNRIIRSQAAKLAAAETKIASAKPAEPSPNSSKSEEDSSVGIEQPKE